MSGSNFVVPPRSWESIREQTEQIREMIGVTNMPMFPVMDMIEKVIVRHVDDFHFLVGDGEMMKGAEGYTSPDGSFIMLHERVYAAACRMEGRARFTAAHELGHWFMHTNIPLARVSDNEPMKPYRLSEPQANQFAAEILMPVRMITRSDTAITAAARFAVSAEAAANRLEYIERHGLLRS
jgi:Zn-dependent peptidase ImmA (M78 family)